MTGPDLPVFEIHPEPDARRVCITWDRAAWAADTDPALRHLLTGAVAAFCQGDRRLDDQTLGQIQTEITLALWRASSAGRLYRDPAGLWVLV